MCGSTVTETIPEGTTLNRSLLYPYPHYRWQDNSDEAITLRNAKGEEVDKTQVVNDNEGDNRYWMRNNSGWTFGVKESVAILLFKVINMYNMTLHSPFGYLFTNGPIIFYIGNLISNCKAKSTK